MSLRDMVWEVIERESKRFTHNHPGVLFDGDGKGRFLTLYQKYRDDFLEKYMKQPETDSIGSELDRHKNAAIIIRSLAEAQVLKNNNKKKKKLFIANEILAVNVALSYMRESLQELIVDGAEKNGCPEIGLSREEATFIRSKPEYRNYPLPVPFSCPEHNYAFVLARDVYYSVVNDSLFHVTLADNLFLLEAYAIEHYKLMYSESRTHG